MNFENEFVAHRKIDFFDLALIKKYRSKSSVINSGGIEIAVIKLAIDKGNAYKITIWKIAIGKRAGFKFFKVQRFLSVADVVVVLLKEIFSHFFRLEVRSGKLEVRSRKLEVRSGREIKEIEFRKQTAEF